MLSLITGVGKKGQVGEAVAAALAARGDTVLLVSRSADEASERARDIAAGGGTAVGYGCDLADADAVKRLAGRVRADHGDRIDALVNAAGGFGFTGPLAESDPAGAAHMMRINHSTAYLVTREFLPSIRMARGAIVYFASEAVLEGTRTGGMSGYVAAKSAVVALMRSVADELADAGVRANAVAPGAIRTAENERSMGKGTRYIERAEVAAVVAFLTSPAASAISGQVLRLR